MAQASLYPFAQPLLIMKPNKIKEDNVNQKAKLDALYDDPDYIAEEKIDGCHYDAIGGRFFSTHISETTGFPVEKTDNFPHLVEALIHLDMPYLILDGEINYPGKRSQDVTAITGSGPDEAIRKQEERGWLTYTVYDILRSPKGDWMINQPWRVRREMLEAVGYRINKICPYVVVNPVIRTNKRQFVEKILENGGEGGVLKNIHSIFVPGKRPMWNQMKVKQELEDDVVIMGFLAPEKMYKGKDFTTWQYWEGEVPVTKHHFMKWIGSISIGKYKNGELTNVGSVTGMSEATRAEFTANPEKYIGKVAHIKGMEKTNDGAYRHFNFVQMHPDKNPHECVLVAR